MAEPSEITAALAAGRRRLGWVYVDPGEPRLSPLREQPSVLRLPPPQGYAGGFARNGLLTMRPRGRWLLLFGVLGLSFAGPTYGASLLVTLACLAWPVYPWVDARRVEAARKKAEAAAHREYEEREDDRWLRIEDYEVRELERVENAARWWPLELPADAERVDVVGGLPAGRRRWLATFGMSVVGRGAPALVVDLSEDRVADGLVELARHHGADRVVRDWALPRDAGILDVLEGLDDDEITEVLAEAASSVRRGEGGHRAEMIDAEVLRSMAACLEAPPTAARLLAALEVVTGRAVIAGTLSVAEIAALERDRGALVDGAPKEHLTVLKAALRSFARAAASSADARSLWPHEGGLAVVRTEDEDPKVKAAVDALVVHALSRRLRKAPPPSGSALFLVTPDGLGQEVLERIVRQVRQLGVLLVLLFERFPPQTKDHVGTAGSTTVFMKLGNDGDARRAAEAIGREHRFELAEISRTDTVSGERSGHDRFSAERRDEAGLEIGLGLEAGAGPSGKIGSTFARSISESWETLRAWSESRSVATGTTTRRVYGFVVEPEEVRRLPSTAFILVEGREGADRAVAGDCNPAIALFGDQA